MDVEIRRTSVTPTDGGSVVQLHISDAPPDAESPSFDLQMSVFLPEYEREILLAQWQREAMKVTQGVLSRLLQELAAALQERDFSPETPRLKKV